MLEKEERIVADRQRQLEFTSAEGLSGLILWGEVRSPGDALESNKNREVS